MSAIKTTTALALLRDKANSAHAGAALSEERANADWNDYLRSSKAAREAWREHGDLLAAITVLERNQVSE